MADYILITGDTVMFNPTFGPAIVVVAPGTLSGTSTDKIVGMPVCVEGDEANVMVPGCSYIAPPFVIPGVGMLSIDSLASDQVAQRTTSNGTPVLLKGSTFNAKFQVMVPAQQPSVPAPVPDPTLEYSGTGSFITTNVRTKGT